MKKVFVLLIIAALAFSVAACAKEAEPEPVIPPEPVIEEPAERAFSRQGAYIVLEEEEDFEFLFKYPDEDFILMKDMDFAGKDIEWQEIEFTGTFDGNFHTIKNVNVGSYGKETHTVYDGNMKPYETHFAGLFGSLENAIVRRLTVENLTVNIDSKNVCCFAGGLAGWMHGSLIEECCVRGRIDLLTSSHCFGVGGFAGYGGQSLIGGSTADMVLVCIDQDKEYKDEQFMGGAYAAGYIDLDTCNIKVDGYDSDHGFVHNGGLVGMYIHYEGQYFGHLDSCNVEGRIKFFEDNKNRRAYCAPYIGEVMNWDLTLDHNTESFERAEVFEYDTDLYPEA